MTVAAPFGLPLFLAKWRRNLAELLLTLEHLSCERDARPLFSGLEARFHAGEQWQVQGPNGSGKTTLLRAIAGIGATARGRILWRGRPVQEDPWAFRRSLLYIGHSPGIKGALTPLENLAWYRALSAGTLSSDSLSALAEVGLAGYEDIPCHQLSAGQLRRVALARLYLSSAPLWILDEPFTAIDKAGVAVLEARFEAHVAAGGLVVMTSHQEVTLPGVRHLDLTAFPPVLREEEEGVYEG